MDNVLVKVNETEMQIKEWRGQRVVTFADIDTVHERPKGTAKRNFVANKKHFIQNEDYVVIKPCDLKNSQKNEIRTSGINKVNPRGTTYFTETGYLMLVKSFTDDLSWDVQRTLVNTYFRSNKSVKQQKLENKDYSSTLLEDYKAEMKELKEELKFYKDCLLKNLQKEIETPAFTTTSDWKRVEFEKLNLIRKHYSETDPDITLSRVMGKINRAVDKKYNVKINDYTTDFINKFGVSNKWYLLDMVEYIPELRTMYEIITDEILEQIEKGNVSHE